MKFKKPKKLKNKIIIGSNFTYYQSLIFILMIHQFSLYFIEFDYDILLISVEMLIYCQNLYIIFLVQNIYI